MHRIILNHSLYVRDHSLYLTGISHYNSLATLENYSFVGNFMAPQSQVNFFTGVTNPSVLKP